MRKLLIGFFLLTVCIESAVSQFDAQMSQYMFHNSAFNPAAIGEIDMVQVEAMHRIHWVGMPNAGQTTWLDLNSPVKIGNTLNGAGLRILNDAVGDFTIQSAHLQYAYKKMLGTGKLSVGVDLGFVSIGFNGDSISDNARDLLGDYYHLNEDPYIPTSSVSGMAFDIGIGAYYSTAKFYGGVSYTHLNSPRVTWNERTSIKERGVLYLTGGYNWRMYNPKWVLKPSALFKSDFATFQLDLSSLLEYDAKYWGGLGLRYQDAVTIMLGANLLSGLSVGYAYDIPVSKIGSWGSHEISLVYNFQIMNQKTKSKYRSIRFL